jgi:hypothetical protein
MTDPDPENIPVCPSVEFYRCSGRAVDFNLADFVAGERLSAVIRNHPRILL